MTILEAIKGGTTYNLSDGSLGYRAEEAGLGLAPLRRYSQRGPRQHGTTPTGYRLEPRIIQLGFVFSTLSWSAHYTRRDALMEIFKPDDEPIALRWTLPNGNVRQIDALYNGGLDFATAGLGGLLQRIAVELLADDPVFYDPVEQEVMVTNNLWTGGMAVPMAVPMSVGVSSFSGSDAIAYGGSRLTYPSLRIYGPIVSPVITHDELDLSIPLTRGGAIIGLGEAWDIDLGGGLKTITDNAGVSRMGWLADESDLAVFRIEGATNTIGMTGSGATGATKLRVRYLDRFIGL